MGDAKKLRVRTMKDLMEGDFPTPGPLLEPILKEGQSCMVWAAPAVGKSLLVLSIALAVASGGGFGPWSAKGTPRKVLLWDGELAMPDLAHRVRNLWCCIEGGDIQAAGQNLKVVARNDQDDGAEFPDIATPEGVDAVFYMARTHGAELVVFDNLATLATVRDENDASELTPILKGLLRFKQAGIAALVVHHANKGGEAFRGSSNLATTFEVIIGLTKRGDVLAEGGGARFALDFTKFRDRRTATIRRQDVELGEDREGNPVWRFEASRGELLEAFAAIIRSGQVTSIEDVGALLPSRFWPAANQSSGKAPRRQWCYDRANEMYGEGVLARRDAESFMRAAKDRPPLTDDEPFGFEDAEAVDAATAF